MATLAEKVDAELQAGRLDPNHRAHLKGIAEHIDNYDTIVDEHRESLLSVIGEGPKEKTDLYVRLIQHVASQEGVQVGSDPNAVANLGTAEQMKVRSHLQREYGIQDENVLRDQIDQYVKSGFKPDEVRNYLDNLSQTRAQLHLQTKASAWTGAEGWKEQTNEGQYAHNFLTLFTRHLYPEGKAPHVKPLKESQEAIQYVTGTGRQAYQVNKTPDQKV